MEAVFSDLLRYDLLLDDGTGNVFVNKNRELMTVFKYTGVDRNSIGELERAAFDKQVNDAFLVFGTGWMIQADAIHHGSTNYPRTVSKNVTVKEIEDYRRRDHSQRNEKQTDIYITITFSDQESKAWLRKRIDRNLPGLTGSLRSIKTLFVEGEQEIASDWNGDIEQFERKVKEFELKLPTSISLRRLSDKEALNYLNLAIHGEVLDLKLPENGEGISDILSDHMEVGFEVLLGDSYKVMIGVVGYPVRAREVELELRRTGIDYKLSSRLILLDEQEALNILEKVRMGWARKIVGIRGALRGSSGGKRQSRSEVMMEELSENTGARYLAMSVKEVEARVSTGETGIAIYSLTVIVSGESRQEVKESAAKVKDVFSKKGYRAIIERGNSVEAMLATFPGEGYSNIRRVPLPISNVVQLLPLGEPYAGESKSPSDLIGNDVDALSVFTTEEKSPYYFNLHDGDVGHSLVIGATGAGKSVFVGVSISQWLARYQNAQVYLFDYGQSGRALCQNTGGHYVNVAEGMGLQILLRADDPTERVFIVDWFMIYLEQMGYEVSDGWRVDIDKAVRSIGKEQVENRTIEEMSFLITANIELEEAIRSIQNGPLKKLYQHVGHLDLANNFVLYEMKELMESGSKYLVPILVYLFHEIEITLSVDRPTLIVVEEAWGALGESMWSDRLKQWLLTLRKRNAALMLITHNISQWYENDKLRDAIGESCKTKILLPNAQAGEMLTRNKYQALGLNEKTIELIIDGVPKREYVIVNSKGARKVRLGLSNGSLDLITKIAEVA